MIPGVAAPVRIYDAVHDGILVTSGYHVRYGYDRRVFVFVFSGNQKIDSIIVISNFLLNLEIYNRRKSVKKIHIFDNW